MRVLLDTSVLVASVVEGHPLHAVAFSWLRKIHDRKIEGYIAAHSLAELYAVLTRLPVHPPVTPPQALDVIRTNILGRVHVVPLSVEDYIAVLEGLAAADLRGGITYDALIVRAAEESSVDLLVTANAEHFRRVAPHLGARISPL